MIVGFLTCRIEYELGEKLLGVFDRELVGRIGPVTGGRRSADLGFDNRPSGDGRRVYDLVIASFCASLKFKVSFGLSSDTSGSPLNSSPGIFVVLPI